MAFRKRLQAVHVPHHKNTAGMKAETLPPPKEVLLPMNMHMGTPAVPVVSVGDYVRVGQKLARGEGSITCEVHATVSGTVLSLDPMPELFGNDLPVIRIENDGKMEVDPTLAPRTAEDLAAFVEDLHESGIVGLGGAAFPVDWKFDAALRHNVKTMLINGAECEPYVTSDNRMMLDHGEDIRRGIELLKKYVKPDNFVFAIENNKPHAIAAMKELFADDSTMSIVELPSSYPQGAKQMILYNALGKVVYAGQRFATLGVIIINVSTLAKVAKFMDTGMPLVDRVVTVDGSAIKEPKNLLVPIGTPYRYLVEAAGGLKCEPGRVVNGGPMMGHAVPSLDYPVLKTTGSVLVFSEADSVIHEPTPCIHCGRCVSHCPMNLNPTAFSDDLEEENGDKRALLLDRDHVNFCIECGSCSYVCPAHRPLAENNRAAKKYLKKYKADHAEGGKK